MVVVALEIVNMWHEVVLWRRELVMRCRWILNLLLLI